MTFDVSVALTWVLYLALFPMTYFWLRRAWRIGFRRDFSEVALKHGEPPADPRRWAPYEMGINAAAGALDYATWSAIAGSTIWCKFFASFALSRHAHGLGAKKKA